MREWRQTAEKNKRLQKKKISEQDQNEIKTLYDQAKKRLILLDYDGTLTVVIQQNQALFRLVI